MDNHVSNKIIICLNIYKYHAPVRVTAFLSPSKGRVMEKYDRKRGRSQEIKPTYMKEIGDSSESD